VARHEDWRQCFDRLQCDGPAGQHLRRRRNRCGRGGDEGYIAPWNIRRQPGPPAAGYRLMLGYPAARIIP
jgi:hypothetical protein